MTPDASDPPVPPTRHARSFDCEFTGLNASPTTGHDLLDTPEERFAKVHACVRAFTVLQVGVAIFSFDPHTRRWTCRPFNFWTIPDAKAGRGVFSAQVASLQFLVDCGFDLNKCVARGIPFVPAAERSRAAAREARLAQRPPIIPSSDRDKAFVANLLIKVAEWLSRSDDDGDGDGDGARDEDLCLDPTNGFLRALTYQILEGDPSRFGGNKARDDPGFIASTSCDFADGRPRIVLSRASREEVATHRAAKEAADRKKDQMKEGFGLVLAKLGACGRPCVGHNALFDCVYVVDKFLAELDGSFEGFKREFDRTVKGTWTPCRNTANPDRKPRVRGGLGREREKTPPYLGARPAAGARRTAAATRAHPAACARGRFQRRGTPPRTLKRPKKRPMETRRSPVHRR